MPDNVPVWWVHEDWFERAEYADFREATLAWITSLGLDPGRLAPRAAVVPWDGHYELHVDEVVPAIQAGGRKGDRGDPLYPYNLMTVRRIVVVEPDSWPLKPDTPEESV